MINLHITEQKPVVSLHMPEWSACLHMYCTFFALMQGMSELHLNNPSKHTIIAHPTIRNKASL